MKYDTCHNCKDQIDAFNENEYFGIKWKVYCSLNCFYEDDSKIKEKRPSDEIQNRPQANKSNNRKNKVHKKKPKQKKRKR